MSEGNGMPELGNVSQGVEGGAVPADSIPLDLELESPLPPVEMTEIEADSWVDQQFPHAKGIGESGVQGKVEAVINTLHNGGIVSVPLEGAGGYSPPVSFNKDTEEFSIAGEPQKPGSLEEGGVALTIGQAIHGK